MSAASRSTLGARPSATCSRARARRPVRFAARSFSTSAAVQSVGKPHSLHLGTKPTWSVGFWTHRNLGIKATGNLGTLVSRHVGANEPWFQASCNTLPSRLLDPLKPCCLDAWSASSLATKLPGASWSLASDTRLVSSSLASWRPSSARQRGIKVTWRLVDLETKLDETPGNPASKAYCRLGLDDPLVSCRLPHLATPLTWFLGTWVFSRPRDQATTACCRLGSLISRPLQRLGTHRA